MGCSCLGAAHSFWLSDKLGRSRSLDVRFFAVIGQARALSPDGCPIVFRYRTSSGALACRMSDCFPLSDKFGRSRLLDVRFFAVIGQVRALSPAGCPILCGYRTSSDGVACWMSDSLRLSDKLGRSRLPDVRLFAVIGQVRTDSPDGCPIVCRYRTSSDGVACRMSDSLPLSDKFGRSRLPDVRFFAVIGQVRALSPAVFSAQGRSPFAI